MKYTLPRPFLHKITKKILLREIKKRRRLIHPIPKKALKELFEVTKSIKSRTLPKHLICKKISDEIGYGIFLDPHSIPLPSFSLIGPYSGEVHLSFEENAITNQHGSRDPSYAISLMNNVSLTKQEILFFDKKASFPYNRSCDLVIDAIKQGNFTRFINCSTKPNIVPLDFSIPKNRYNLSFSPIEKLYFTAKEIQPGEQLLTCYGARYWQNKSPFPMTAKTFQLQKEGHLLFDKTSQEEILHHNLFSHLFYAIEDMCLNSLSDTKDLNLFRLLY